jgi:hypothetical protein
MTTAARSTATATIQPVFTDPERLALAGFLAGYRGLTREAYALDLRHWGGAVQLSSLLTLWRSCRREMMSSLRKIFFRWYSTVWAVMNSRSAISWFA